MFQQLLADSFGVSGGKYHVRGKPYICSMHDSILFLELAMQHLDVYNTKLHTDDSMTMFIQIVGPWKN
jgi:hypothetical protein